MQGKSTVDVVGATANIHLVASEHVTCTYTNTYVPPPGGLVIYKVTRGGVGTFDYTVTPEAGGAAQDVSATTTDQGVPATAEPSLGSLAPGTYKISEKAPDSAAGHWRAVSVDCNGEREHVNGDVTVTITSDQSSTCTFFNRFIPAGSISISKISQGATGTFTFLVGLRDTESAMQYTQRATTKAEGKPADAVPDTPLDATNHLKLGRYIIVEQFPFVGPAPTPGRCRRCTATASRSRSPPARSRST